MGALILIAIIWIAGGVVWLVSSRVRRRDGVALRRFQSAIDIVGGFSDPAASTIATRPLPLNRSAPLPRRLSLRARRRFLTRATIVIAVALTAWAIISPGRTPGAVAASAMLLSVVYQQLAIAYARAPLAAARRRSGPRHRGSRRTSRPQVDRGREPATQ